MWRKSDLKNLMKEQLGDYLFILASNRQPYVHTLHKGKIVCNRTPGGVITALDPVMQACNGTWFAYGNGDADQKMTDPEGKIRLPQEDPQYTLKRIWLDKDEVNGYYNGFSNEALWPLCHMAFERPTFREEDWNYYQKVNEKFAKAILQEAGGNKAFIWIQDYHLCLLPQYLKRAAPNQFIIAHFWHIPFPSYETFRVCPQKKAILEGLLSNDLIGFQIQYHCNNFIDVVDRELESKIDRERFSVIRGGFETLVRPFPISVDFEGINRFVESDACREMQGQLKDEFRLEGQRIMLGVERIDYTKGIPEKLLALEKLLEKHPQLRGKIVFVLLGAVSRIHVERYKMLNNQIESMVERINWEYSTGDWNPIVAIGRPMSYKEILSLYKMSEICIVSSLHDGMNLVAKEFIASRNDTSGVLLLSQFTGASRELTEAIMINPYDRNEFCDAMVTALSMTKEERHRRMDKMRKTLEQHNIFRWAGKIVSDLLKFEFKEEQGIYL